VSLADLAAEEGAAPRRTEQQNGKMEKPGVRVSPGGVTVIAEPGKMLNLGDLRRLIESRGMNPDDWAIKDQVINEWTGFAVIDKRVVTATNTQLKVRLEPRPNLQFPIPARTDGPKWTGKPRGLDGRKSLLVAIFPDQQIPYHDRGLHDSALGWLEQNKPDRVVLSGDAADLPTVSTHPVKAHELNTSLKKGIHTTYGVFRDYRMAVPDAEMDLVPGNHEMRLQNSILRFFPQLYGLTRPGDDLAILSLPYLLRLDELGIKWATDPVYKQDYPYGHVVLNKNLAVYHGWLAKEGAGTTALATLRHLGHSVIVGHTHRQAYTPHTYHEISGKQRVLGGWEAGTMAMSRGGLGYSVAPNWQQGFMTVRLYPDGLFKAEHATYVNNVLLWGEQRFVKGKAA
jgi:hypothetical protein